VRGYDALADDYIVKPFDHAELFSKVQAYFRVRNMKAAPEDLGAEEMLMRQFTLVGQMNKTLRERLVSFGRRFRACSPSVCRPALDGGPTTSLEACPQRTA
jgi:DNA-binding response OmpR family regulator